MKDDDCARCGHPLLAHDYTPWFAPCYRPGCSCPAYVPPTRRTP